MVGKLFSPLAFRSSGLLQSIMPGQQVLRKIALCVLSFVLLINTNLFAQIGSTKPKIPFRHLNIDLNDNRIESIYQDSQGYIWIGTLGGLHRYDGVSTLLFLTSDDTTTTNGDRASSIFEDSQKRLWIGTENGMCLYDRENGRFVRIKTQNPLIDPVDPTPNRIMAMTEGNNHELWIASERLGVLLFDEKSKIFKPYFNPANVPSLSRSHAMSLFKSKDGTLWIGTAADGLFSFNPKSGAYNQWVHNPKNSNSLSSNYIEDIIIDRNNNLWIATHENGLDKLDLKSNTFQHYHSRIDDKNSLGNNDVINVFEDSSGKIWVSNENGGLHLFNPSSNNFYRFFPDITDPFSVSNISIRVVYEDRQKRLWVGSNLEGIDVFDQFINRFQHYYQTNDFESINNNVVRSIMEDEEGNLWLATDGGGLNIFNRKVNNFTVYKHDPKNPTSIGANAVLKTCVDKQGDVWVATWRGGINVFNRKSKKFKRLDPTNPDISKVFFLMKDQDQNMWAGTQTGGVSMFDVTQNKFITYRNEPHNPKSLGDNDILGIIETTDRDIWIVTEFNGLNRVEIENGKRVFRRFLHNAEEPNSLSSNRTNHAFEDSKKNLWIATEGGLSLFIRETQTFKNYTVKDGFATNQIKSISEDDHGNLWMGTSKGLTKFNPDKKTVRNYTYHDGLQRGDFARYSVCKTRAGELVFGGSNGFNIFHPDSIRDNPFSPDVYITGLKIFNKQVMVDAPNSPLTTQMSETKELTLSYKQSVFSLDFVALNYTQPDMNQFAFRMEGFENDWNYMGNQRTATYTSLDPGQYVFRVKAANNDGLWNETGASLVINILPPWWNTWLFKSIAIMATLLLATFIWIMRTRGIREANRILTEAVNVKTMELQEKNRELLKREEEIEAQNEELMQSQEEISSQRDVVAKQNETLEVEVEKRTRELVEYNQQLEQFAFISAHNLRAPVARILGLGHLLDITKGDHQEIEKIYPLLISAVTDLDTVVKDLNTILELKHSSDSIISELNLARELEAICESIESEIQASNAQILKHFEPTMTIQAVKPYLDSILYNLLSNAIKYRHAQRQPEIHIYAEQANGETCITISDNGIGINLTLFKDKVFKLYSRFHQHAEGKGIGLYLVKTQVTSMGGRVEVSSEVDKGTTFKIFLKS